MRTDYRAAGPQDMTGMGRLMEEYMQETYQDRWHGNEEALKRDGLGVHFNLTLAITGNVLSGFVAWRATYDLHHCLAGLDVIDMFVRPAERGRGIGACLLARVAGEGAGRGATFMTGGAVESGSAGRLYRRVTMTHGGQTYLSGRAFRAFSELAGASPRELLRGLPKQEWNYQP